MFTKAIKFCPALAAILVSLSLTACGGAQSDAAPQLNASMPVAAQAAPAPAATAAVAAPLPGAVASTAIPVASAAAPSAPAVSPAPAPAPALVAVPAGSIDAPRMVAWEQSYSLEMNRQHNEQLAQAAAAQPVDPAQSSDM